MTLKTTASLTDEGVIQTTDVFGEITYKFVNVKADQLDSAIRQKLIDLGWTPPGDPIQAMPRHKLTPQQIASVKKAEPFYGVRLAIDNDRLGGVLATDYVAVMAIEAREIGAGDLVSRYMEHAPPWATHLTTDAHGYVIAWDREPKQTAGGLFYSAGRSSVLSKPGYVPGIFAVTPGTGT